MAKPSRPHENRWSARKKTDAVVRLMREESLEELSREVRVEAHRLQACATSSWPAASKA
ncbi:MAG: hypothetical protein Q8P50_09330 [Bacillota bacterium]|nr:hypothetical protein [Bacillota bacterium]